MRRETGQADRLYSVSMLSVGRERRELLEAIRLLRARIVASLILLEKRLKIDGVQGGGDSAEPFAGNIDRPLGGEGDG